MAAVMNGRQRRVRSRRERSCDEHGSAGPRVSALTAVKRAARTQLTFGAVVWAHVPFEDEPTEKTRPAVVVELMGTSVSVLPATSAASRLRFRDRHVEIDDLDSAGLRRPTGVRLRTVRIDVVEVIEIVGRLGDDDAGRLTDRLGATAAA